MSGRSFALILAAIAILVVPLLYVAGYFWLGDRRDWHWRDGLATIERTYPEPWMRTAFQLGGWVEEQFQGVNVQITCGSHDRNETPTTIFGGQPEP